MNGWICLSRKILDCYLWKEKPFSKAQAWIDLLLLASHEKKKFLLGNELIEVERGEFITSEVKLMDRWGWGKAKVRAFLLLLEKDEMIIKKTDHKKTTITIVNYSKFQDIQTTDRPSADREQTSVRPSADTINNNNNINKENNIREAPKKKPAAFIPPTLEQVTAYCKERKNNVDPKKFFDYYTAGKWKDGKGEPVKNWKQKIITWEKHDTSAPQKKTSNSFHNFEERKIDCDDLMKRFVRN